MILKNVFMLHAASSIIILLTATSYATAAAGVDDVRQQKKAEALSAANSPTSTLTKPVKFGEKIGKAEVLSATPTSSVTSIQYPRGGAAETKKQELRNSKLTKNEKKIIANKIQSRGRRSRGENGPIETSQLENLYETNIAARGSKRTEIVNRVDDERVRNSQQVAPTVHENGYEYHGAMTPPRTRDQTVLNRSRSSYTNPTQSNSRNEALDYMPQEQRQQQQPQTNRRIEKTDSQRYAYNKALEIESRNNIQAATIENNGNTNTISNSRSNNSNFFNNNAQTSFINKYKSSLQNVANGGSNRNRNRQSSTTQNIPTIAATTPHSRQRERISLQNSRPNNSNTVRPATQTRYPAAMPNKTRNPAPVPIRRISTNVVTTSPLTSKFLNIISFFCGFFKGHYQGY